MTLNNDNKKMMYVKAKGKWMIAYSFVENTPNKSTLFIAQRK
jgi:hypothetical protein